MKTDNNKNRILKSIMLVAITALLILPFPASCKYESDFSRTVDLIIYPPIIDGADNPTDGVIINDKLSLPPGSFVRLGTKSEAGYTLSTPSDATKSEINSQNN